MRTSLSANERIFHATRGGCRNWTGPLILTAVLLAAIYGVSPNFRFNDSSTASPFAGDFLQEWVGGYIVRAGNYDRFYDIEYAQKLEHDERLIGFRWNEERYLPIVYPPFYYAAVSPLSFLPVRAAAWVWAALMVACLIGSAWLLVWHFQNAIRPSAQGSSDERCLHESATLLPNQRAHSPPKWLPWLLPAALIFMPLIENFTSSQKGTVCLLILSGTYVLLDRKKPYLAGLVFGLLAFKPQLTLVIAVAMLFKGQWRFVLGGVTTGIILGGVSLALGLDVCRQYFAFSTGAADYLHTRGYDLAKSHCLYGFFTLLSGGEATTIIKGVTFVATAGVAALLAIALRHRLQPGTPQFALQYSALVVATLLVSPHLFTYDLTILLLPIGLIGLVNTGPSVSPTRRTAMGWLLAVVATVVAVSPLVASQTSLQLSTLSFLAALALVAQEAGQGRTESWADVATNGPNSVAKSAASDKMNKSDDMCPIPVTPPLS